MLKPNPSVIFTQLNDGESVLLHMESKLYYSLNGTGSFMWQLLESQEVADEPGLIGKLTDHYQISLETAQGDVKEFVHDLLSEGLLQKIKSP